MQLFIFHHIIQDPVIAALLRFRETGREEDYYPIAQGLIHYAEHRLTDRNIIKEYILRTMLEKDRLPDIIHLRDFLRQDIKSIYHSLLDVDWDSLFREKGFLPLGSICTHPLPISLPSYVRSLESMMDCGSNEALGGAILAHAETFGTGISTAYAALRWNSPGFVGISCPDPIRFEDLAGLTHQKEVLIANTDSFMRGYPANDILLTGSSGTGKSACVKACLNLFKDRGLRLIELGKSRFHELPAVFDAIKNQELKYIIYLDDLSFEPDENHYKLLHSVLDGQTGLRRSNVLIYATANHPSLMQELRSEGEDEIRFSAGLNGEKSLADRFGIHLSFLTPTQNEYLAIVAHLLSAAGLSMTEELKAKALSWQSRYNGFSGRTAKQFVAGISSNQ